MKFLLILSLALFSAQSFAKMTKFSTVEAVKFVLNDEVAMSKVFKQSQTDVLVKVEVAETAFNEFEVAVQTAKLDWRCDTTVKVKTKKIIAQIPGGASITANELVLGKVSKSECVE
jgi:hypothetical protein